jgi:hypothetical protein
MSKATFWILQSETHQIVVYVKNGLKNNGRLFATIMILAGPSGIINRHQETLL